MRPSCFALQGVTLCLVLRGATDPPQTSLSPCSGTPQNCPKALHNYRGSLASNCWTLTSLCLSVLICKMGWHPPGFALWPVLKYILAYMSMWMHVCTCVWRPEVNFQGVYLPLSLSVLCVKRLRNYTYLLCVCVSVCTYVCALANGLLWNTERASDPLE